MKTKTKQMEKEAFKLVQPFTVELKKEGTYILGVSGGPDSMALFDMCRHMGISIVALHMNYRKRDSAQRDEDIVKTYCMKYGIPFEVRWQNKECEGNFQAFARRERYYFYRDMCEKYNAEGVLLAHHLDDHLETYIMQKERKSIGEYYGIRAQAYLYDCNVLRPLLSYTKQELLTYCIEHGVPYGMDESNFTNDYTRNRIRHEIIDHLCYEEKQDMIQVIAQENKVLENMNLQCDTFLKHWDGSEQALRELKDDVLEVVLSNLIFQRCHIRISKKECELLRKLIQQKSKQWTRDIKGEYSIYNEYDNIYITENKEITYSYVIPSIELMCTPYFEIKNKGKSVEALTLTKEDFPITIRNAREGDKICLRFGNKRISRWFIDRKIPRNERKLWPVVENAEGNIILVPGIGCDIAHFSNNPSIFVVK